MKRRFGIFNRPELTPQMSYHRSSTSQRRRRKYRRAILWIVGCGALSFLILASAMIYGCLPSDGCSKAMFGL